MSLLTIIQDACREISISSINAVVNNESGNAPILFRVAKEELTSLGTRNNWQILTKENTFTTTATTVQVTASAVPVDFDRMVNDSIFNRTSKRKVWGPITPQEWQDLQAHSLSAVDPLYRLRGGTILMYPAPSSGDTVAYEYISTYKARSSTGTQQENWQNDADTTVFPERIVTLGVVWRYKKAKGYSFTADLEEYERRVIDAIAADGSKPIISTDAPMFRRRPAAPIVPDTLVGL